MDRSPLTMPRQLPRRNPGQKVLLWRGVLGKTLHNPVVSCNGGRELGSCGATSASLPITLTQEELLFSHHNRHKPKNPPYLPCQGQWSKQRGQ